MTHCRATDEVISRLQRMDDYDFEHFVADLWERQGWETEVSQASVDAGIDIRAVKKRPFDQKVLVQAKRYGPKSTVGGPEVQQYASLKHQEDNVDSVIVVTTNSFTNAAERRADELNVKLVDGHGIVDLVDEFDAFDLVERYSIGESGGFEESYESLDTMSSERSPTNHGKVRAELEAIPADVYLYSIYLGTIAWTIGFGLAMAGYSGGPFGSLIGWAAIVGWISMPPGFYYDGERVSEETEWNPRRILFCIGGGVPFLNALVGGVYLYLRRRAYRTTEPDEVDSKDPGDGVGG